MTGLINLTPQHALEHYFNGGGLPITMNTQSHMTQGPGRFLTLNLFSVVRAQMSADWAPGVYTFTPSDASDGT